jgi:hypothetical protein
MHPYFSLLAGSMLSLFVLVVREKMIVLRREKQEGRRLTSFRLAKSILSSSGVLGFPMIWIPGHGFDYLVALGTVLGPALVWRAYHLRVYTWKRKTPSSFSHFPPSHSWR